MSITDELREYAQSWRETPNLMDELDAGDIDGLLGDIEHIADRIDAEHENAMYDMRREHDEWVADRDANWVTLPVDADGKVIHIGDVMEGVDKYDSLKKVMGEVTTISFDATFDPDDSRSVGIRVWSDDRRSYHTAYLDPRASVYRHYHASTVEDVLAELLREYDRDDSELTNGEIIERFAAKLRLADDGKEQ